MQTKPGTRYRKLNDYIYDIHKEGRWENMLRIGKRTKLAPEQVMIKASMYFGKDGRGLEKNEQLSCHPCNITFEGGGGYVTISINDEDRHRMVDVETREFEYQAKQFLEKV